MGKKGKGDRIAYFIQEVLGGGGASSKFYLARRDEGPHCLHFRFCQCGRVRT